MKKKRFIFDETYIKRYRNKGKVRGLVIGISVLVLIFIIIIVILATKAHSNRVKPVVKPTTPSFELKDELVIESGSPLPEVTDYFKKLENVDVSKIKVNYPDQFEISYDTSNCSAEELEVINELDHYDEEAYKCASQVLKGNETYGITINIDDEDYTVNLVVKDTLAPTVLIKNVEIFEGQTYKAEDFVSGCSDASDTCNITFAEVKDEAGRLIDFSNYKDVGTYNVSIVASDAYNNVSKVIQAELKISESEKPLVKVTFNSNGGSRVDALSVQSGSVIVEPNAPVREGYVFDGWYLGNDKFNFQTAVTSNVTLTARWKKMGEPVDPGVVGVTSISLNYRTIYLTIGESKTVKATVKPNNASNKTVTWTSSDNSIVPMNQ